MNPDDRPEDLPATENAQAAQERGSPARGVAALTVRLRFSEDARIGPGKVALLEAIAREGSIAAAGKEMGMSYRRAWLLIDSLNRLFIEPVVHVSPDDTQGGSAELSALGTALVKAYRDMERDTERAVRKHFAAISPHMRHTPT